MDDLEYSVEICDRDWEGFFAECEECNLLPPSLAGVDDSGMSDIDDIGFCLAQRAQRIDPTQDSSENEHHIDDTIECAGSPVEHCFTKHGIGGLDSVLSGSEEDLHLQSVNIFFERLKIVKEAESSQVRVGNKAIQEEEQCGNGQQASRNNLPKNFPKSNTLPASSETALGTETVRPVGASGNLKTKEKINAESNISYEPAAFSNLKVKSCKPSEIEPFIRKEASRETRVNEVAQWNQSYDSTNSVEKQCLEMCRSLDEQEGLLTSQVRFSKKSGTIDIPNQESSPSSSLRRKKKKKRRLSVEAGQACERQVLVKQTDSEEEQHASREGAGLCLSEESVHLNEPQENLTYLPTSYSSNLPVGIFANQIQNVHLPNAECHQSDDNVMFSASNGANDTKHLQLYSKLQVENSAGLFGNENQNHVVNAGDLQKFDKMNTSVNGCENEQYQNYSPAEDKSVSLLPSAESCAPPVEVSQNVKQSNAKSVLAAEAGNSGKDKSTLCQSELQQQLESDCHDTNPCSRTLGNVHFSAIHTLDAKSSQLEISDEVISTNLTSDCINQPYDKSYVPTYLSSLDPEQQTDHPIEVKTSDISSEKNTETERYPSEASQKLVLTCHTQTESKLSLSEGLKTSPSDITLVSSCCTLDTDSVTSFSNENLTDMSLSFCSSASEHESGSQGEKKVPILVKHEAEDFPPGPKSKPECKCDILGEAEDAVTASKAVDGPEKMEKSVFAMSSFWREMEKVTINDILGLRYIRKASSLPPVRESEETDLFAVCDQGNFTQNDESKQTEQITEETSVTEPYYSRSEVTWDSELVPVSHGGIIYPVNTLLASVTDTSEPVLSERSQKCIRKISKAISVHNLQALESESFGYTQKGQPLQTLDESESVKFEYITGDSAPKIDKDVKSLPSSVTDSYSISLTDIFQYLFGGKQSVPHHSATDDISTLYTGGNSVPETYDHFFSEFDTENFFYPLITAEEKKQDKTVPIFSCSRSAGRNLQFPEAYEYFFASSSSDDSSVESDEEDNCPPARVVSRFTPKTSSAEINTDIYEDFFTDSDFRDEFFCLKSLSFRKVKFSASRAQKQKSNSVSLVPVRQSCRSTLRADPHLNALGNSDVMFPDPLLYHLEERISRQLAQQPFIYEDLQATISNPGLDAPLMPLKQSDMCLVCIAFASWVLKTANPQVGDAWKAVLLANISALSAIRYLRKYVKMEAAANETTLHQPALTYP